jgi:hypothetical protein
MEGCDILNLLGKNKDNCFSMISSPQKQNYMPYHSGNGLHWVRIYEKIQVIKIKTFTLSITFDYR